ncbi:MAG: hypothetical protein ACLSDJ_08680 [Butyricimonas faecihominis]
MTKNEIEQEITKEWRKEYIGEGQMFYYYKRLGLMIPNASVKGIRHSYSLCLVRR